MRQWAQLPDDERGEWVDGQLVEEEMPNHNHELVLGLLVHALISWAKRRGGFVFGSEAKYRVTSKRGRKPDIAVFLAKTRKPPLTGISTVPPTIAIEIISPSPRDVLRDRVHKLVEYAEFGVRYYWLVDPQLRSLEIFELSAEKRFVHVLAGTDGIVRRVPGCPGLELDLDDIWSELDRLAKA